jgi:RimJ/RimL family protein N-acetyltransferase
MNNSDLSVREMQESDIDSIAGYWLHSENSFLQSMGVDMQKLPSKEQLSETLLSQLNTPLEKRRSYCIIWQIAGNPVGHCNTNPTYFGKEAFMHLHLWNARERQKGMGAIFIKMTLPFFFEKLQLKRLYCEPYALNEAPNRTLKKLGFSLIREYTTTPGSLNFEQPVKRWELSREKYQQVSKEW